MKPIATPSRTKEILERYDLHAKKRYGQNFIIEPKIIGRIVQAADVNQQTAVIEIGPGIGALSEALLGKVGTLFAYDIDADMVSVLQSELGHYPHFHIYHEDFLKVDLTRLCTQLVYPHIKIVANLPYYITTKLLEKIILEGQAIEEVVVMVQKDVALKMSASAHLKDRLPLNVLLENIAVVKTLFEVPPSVFWPTPKVASAILDIRFKSHEINPNYYLFLKRAFASRRKTLRNNLKGQSFDVNLEELLCHLGYGLDVRAEQISGADFEVLFKHAQSEDPLIK